MIRTMIRELQSTNSHIDKVAILKKYDTPKIREFLKCTYDPYTTYGVTWDYVDPINASSHLEEVELDILKRLKHRMLTGQAAIDTISTCLFKRGNLLAMVLSRDLKCGISVTTINKAFPGLIHKFKLQKAKPVAMVQIPLPGYAQIKYDGVRLRAVVNNHIVTLLTSSGKEAKLVNLETNFTFAPDGAYDGELVSKQGRMQDRTNISGRLNSAMHGGTPDESDITFKVFDYLTLNEIASNYCNLGYETRYNRLKKKLGINPTKGYIQLTDHFKVNTLEELSNYYNSLIDKGFEGVIVKKPKGLYRFTRSSDWIKLKEILDADLLCTGVEDGSGQYEGAIGALICEGIVQGKSVKVNVSGLTAEARWADPDTYIGKTIEIKYNSVIVSKTGSAKPYSLFIPRFSRVRTDK